MTFTDLGLPPQLLTVLSELRYHSPTPVQKETIPAVLSGVDVIATAQTGTGKTAAFALPLITRMMLNPKEARENAVLVLTPTRELAEQIGQVVTKLLSQTPEFHVSVIIGGLAYQNQIASLRHQPVFVVGTPGRLIDLVEQKKLDLNRFRTLVIDEADRLLDMGFLPQMNQLVRHLPEPRQSLMFSATMADPIIKLANAYLRDPLRIAIGPSSRPVERIRQTMVRTTSSQKDETLIREIDKVAGSLIVFTRTKSRTEKVAKLLDEAGHEVVRLHGDRTQRQRSVAIAKFRDGSARILVATDIAARGIDVPEIRHVVNYDLPICAEDYIHRIGRTARGMESNGNSISLVTPEEEKHWAKIFKLIHGHKPTGLPAKNSTKKNKGPKDRSATPSGRKVQTGKSGKYTPLTSGRKSTASKKRRRP